MKLLEANETTYRLEDGDGKVLVYPRVTAILRLVQDFSQISPERLAHAAERGKAVHRGCWVLCGGGDNSGLHWPSVHPELVPYLRAFEEARKSIRFSVVWKEKLVASTRFEFAGRVDIVADGISKWRSVLDLKSGEEHPSHKLQLAGYLQALKETEGGRAYDRHILYLRPNGTYRLAFLGFEDQDRDFRVFSALLQVYRWRQSHAKG